MVALPLHPSAARMTAAITLVVVALSVLLSAGQVAAAAAFAAAPRPVARASAAPRAAVAGDDGRATAAGAVRPPPAAGRLAEGGTVTRRFAAGALVVAAAASAAAVRPAPARAVGTEGAAGTTGDDMFAPRFVQTYEDFVQTPCGMSYRDVTMPRPGGAIAARGDRVVFEWSGYTIGYFGRPFQAKGGPQGGAFDRDLDYARTVLGSGTVVEGLEEALLGLSAGAVRQVVVPYGPLSYPPTDPGHDTVGPKPTTFSGQRALNFVLDNPRIDRTLLFNVKVIRVDKPNASGGFTRG